MRRIYLIGMLALVAVFVACSSGTGTGTGGGAAPSSPAVQILVPAFGETFTEGEPVGVQSVATDPSGITRIELFIDGQLVKTDQAPAQGQTQFNVVQVWLADKTGAHTVLVRAFNAANASGEASIPIAVSASANRTTDTDAPGATTRTTIAIANVTETVSPAVAPTQTPIIVVVTATPPPSTPLPPTPIPPTPIPPTPIPPTPVPPTVPPLVFLPPFDGGMNVVVDWDGEQVQLEANANDVVVGRDDGDGIAYVEFFIQDLNGNVIATKRENNKPYCFFGEAQGQCTTGRLGESNFQWGQGKAIRSGWYFIRAVAHTPDNRIQVAERSLYVNLGDVPEQSLFVFVVEPGNFNIERELNIEGEVEGQSANSGIDYVDLFLVTYDGKIVHKRTERNARYCGFGGGDNNQPCPIYDFYQNGGKWPDGDPVFPTQYIVRAIAYAHDGAVAADAVFFQIDRVQ